jgi:signal peptidase
MLLVVGAWFVLLRPQALGGPAALVMVTGESMEPTLHAGDLAVAFDHESYAVGDVVAYRIPQGDAAAGQLVIHRIVAAADEGFTLRGDNAASPDIWRPRAGDVAGRLALVLPGGAHAVEWLRQPLVLGSLALVAWVAIVLRPARDEDR